MSISDENEPYLFLIFFKLNGILSKLIIIYSKNILNYKNLFMKKSKTSLHANDAFLGPALLVD